MLTISSVLTQSAQVKLEDGTIVMSLSSTINSVRNTITIQQDYINVSLIKSNAEYVQSQIDEFKAKVKAEANDSGYLVV
jgi:hypothetical protein